MTSKKLYSISSIHVKYLILDMSDCYTWSFPEFIPFCTQLYYFSSFKAFKTLTQAWWLQDLGLLFLYVFQHTALVYALKNNKAMTIWSDGKPVSSMDFQLAYNRTIVYYLTVLMHNARLREFTNPNNNHVSDNFCRPSDRNHRTPRAAFITCR